MQQHIDSHSLALNKQISADKKQLGLLSRNMKHVPVDYKSFNSMHSLQQF